MEQKIIPYGTKHTVKVLNAEKYVLTVVDENDEGYILMGHGLKTLPEKNDTGTIVFERNNGPSKGHWQFYPDKK